MFLLGIYILIVFSTCSTSELTHVKKLRKAILLFSLIHLSTDVDVMLGCIFMTFPLLFFFHDGTYLQDGDYRVYTATNSSRCNIRGREPPICANGKLNFGYDPAKTTYFT